MKLPVMGIRLLMTGKRFSSVLNGKDDEDGIKCKTLTNRSQRCN